MAANHSSITYEDGSLYEGTLHPQSGLPHGEGMMKFSDGSVYSGQWADDLREGVGTERCAVLIGAWHAGRRSHALSFLRLLWAPLHRFPDANM